MLLLLIFVAFSGKAFNDVPGKIVDSTLNYAAIFAPAIMLYSDDYSHLFNGHTTG